MNYIQSKQVVEIKSGLPGNIVSPLKNEDTNRRTYLELVTPCPKRSRKNKHCANCQKEKTGKGTTCLECYAKIRKTIVYLECELCTEVFTKPLCEYEKQLRRRPDAVFYCGLYCSRKHHSFKNARKCQNCQIPMPGKKDKKYCSQECIKKVAWERKTGKTPDVYNWWFRKMRPLILERDDYSCVVCSEQELFIPLKSRTGKLTFRSNICIHHLDENKENNIPENLLSVCMRCHQVHHNSKVKKSFELQKLARDRSLSMISRW